MTSAKLGDTRDYPRPIPIHWRTNSFNGNNGTCIELAAVPDRHIAVCHSTSPENGTILFTHTERASGYV